jgi:peroxiredoxin
VSTAEQAGLEVIAVSPDSNAQSQKLADGLHVSYRFVADRDLAVARSWGLVHPRGGPSGQDVPRPATVVLDREGVVRWFSISRNYQVRPDPADVLRAVRALRTSAATIRDR